MRVLLTRPEQDSLSTQSVLEALGISVTIEPLFEIEEILPIDMPEGKIQALVFTSRNSVRAFCGDNPLRDVPIYCVGDETARVASEFGFDTVHSANGDMHDLSELICNECDTSKGMLVRFVVEMEHDRLAEELIEAGFDVHSRIVYRMNEVPRLKSNTLMQLDQRQIDGVCFFSPRAARHFYTLLTREALTKACRSMTAWCISENTARALAELPFQRVRVADRPTLDAMIDLIKR